MVINDRTIDNFRGAGNPQGPPKSPASTIIGNVIRKSTIFDAHFGCIEGIQTPTAMEDAIVRNGGISNN